MEKKIDLDEVSSVESSHQSVDTNNSTSSNADTSAKDKKGKKGKDEKAPKSETPQETEKENIPKFIKIKAYLSKKYDFQMNIISNDLYYKPKDKTEFEICNFDNLVCELFERAYTGFDKHLTSLLKSSFVPQYNPFSEYFKNLPEWDKKTDYIELLANHVKAKNQNWFNSQFKKMLVRMVAQALNKIDFNKHCFTLVGNQNDGKTSFLRYLTPPPLASYYKENLDFQSKDGRIALCQNFMINLDELANFSKHDINQVKAFFSMTFAKERLPFDRTPSHFPRCASFVGSTNNREFLTDTTGSVRWLVFEYDSIDFSYTKIDIDLVYAQAYYLLNNGFESKLTKGEIEFSEGLNRNFQVLSTEIELLDAHYEPAEKNAEKAEFLTATNILIELTNLFPKLNLNKVQLGKALQFLKFVQTPKYDNEKKFQLKGYYLIRKKSSE